VGQLPDRDRIRALFDLRGATYATRGGSFDVDPYPTFRRLRESGPVHPRAPHEELGWTGDVFFQGLPYPNRPHFSAYDFETCSAIFRDETCFVTNPEPWPDETPMPDSAILFMDGTRHLRYRRLVQPSFAPARAVWWLENWIEDTIDQLIGMIQQDNRSDLNLDFCAPIPLLTITGSFGITTEEALEVREAVTSDGRGVDVLGRLLLPIIEARRSDPRDDLISVLAEAEVTDEDGTTHRLDDIEILGFGLLLLAAGSGTTWKQMGITLVAMLSDPRVLETVRADRSFLKRVFDESLRWTPTDPVFARFVKEDCELGGVALPAGAVIHACLASANRDPARWEHPDEFDPFRAATPHLGFGHGVHACLGMHLARTEVTAAIEALLDRLPDLRLDPDEPLPRIIGLYERGPDSVPVRFGTRA
jgi:cytochrome P450